MLNPEALLYDVPLLHWSVPAAAELRGITIKDKYLIPNNYANRTEDGIFLSEPDLKNVSGVLFRNNGNENYSFYPNPFCHSEINSPDIQKIFSF